MALASSQILFAYIREPKSLPVTFLFFFSPSFLFFFSFSLVSHLKVMKQIRDLISNSWLLMEEQENMVHLLQAF